MDACRIEDSIAQASIGMVRGKSVSIDDGRGIEMRVAYGSIWITQDEDTRDICLGAGESFHIDRKGTTLVTALKPSLVTLTPSTGRARLRVSMLGSAAPTPLFETGSRRKSSRFDAWLERFWAPLFVASARPTTGAL